MGELNQKVSVPTSQIKEKSYGSKILLFILGAVTILIGVGEYVLWANKTQAPVADNVLPQPSPTPIDKTVNPDSIGANWKTYTNIRSANPYSFSYPPDWKISVSEGSGYYANIVTLGFMNGTVGIIISDNQSPYSFPGENNFKSQELEIMVAGKEYAVKETTINNIKAYVDFSTDAPNKIHILFGTGYPAASDSMKSLDKYYKTRDTIFKILSTLKFIQ